MRNISPEDVPEFRDLLHFTEWYLDSGMPVLLPPRPEVFLSDDATATCLFRSGRYQFEMYFIHPDPFIPLHEHPGVENIEIPSEGWASITRDMLILRTQTEGKIHGKSIRERSIGRGFALFSAQRWSEGIEMSTIGARWRGVMAGPKHEDLIRRFNPNCYIQNGYADVTRQVDVAAPVL